ncbi:MULTISPECIES: TIGR03747 family integrating conjugative element membrane protein [Pseudomonas]|uniref:TIGR03747 family integrating conjugative element membrane protein n=1 Tax=Pseudomonas TaxID=286 RepID=UPI0032B1E25D
MRSPDENGRKGQIQRAGKLCQSQSQVKNHRINPLAVKHHFRYGLAAVYAALTFLARILILILTLPLFLMAVFTGLIDGLVRRNLRRFGAGRESGFIYHRAKRMIVPLWIAPWIIYPALPMTVSPLLVLLPSAAALGVVVSISAGSFKKYL